MEKQDLVKGTLYIIFPKDTDEGQAQDQLLYLDDLISNNEEITIQDLVESNYVPTAKFTMDKPSAEAYQHHLILNIHVSILIWLGLPKHLNKKDTQRSLNLVKKWISNLPPPTTQDNFLNLIHTHEKFRHFVILGDQPRENELLNFFEIEVI